MNIRNALKLCKRIKSQQVELPLVFSCWCHAACFYYSKAFSFAQCVTTLGKQIIYVQYNFYTCEKHFLDISK